MFRCIKKLNPCNFDVILAETKENTLLLLLNAIYFKGFWTNPFNKALTKKGPFYLNSKTMVDVTLMTTYNNFKISNLESLNSRLISLPYEVKYISLKVMLPVLLTNYYLLGGQICYVRNIAEFY